MQKYKKISARISSIVLSVAMVFTATPMGAFAADDVTPVADATATVQSFHKLDDRFTPSIGENAPDNVYALSVPLDTAFEDLQLPTELTAMVERARASTSPEAEKEIADSEPAGEETVPVTWTSDKEYKSNENGKFIYTAELSEGYVLADGVKLPQIYVFVGRQARTTSTYDYEIDLANVSGATSEGFTLSDGALTLTGDGGKTYRLHGDGGSNVTNVVVENAVTVALDNVTVNAPITANAIKLINGGTISVLSDSTLTSEFTDGSTSGCIFSEENLTILGLTTATLTATSHVAENKDNGDWNGGNAIAGKEKLTIKANIAATGSYAQSGIASYKDVEIKGGTITTAGNYGIYAGTTITFSGNDTVVKATGQRVSALSQEPLGGFDVTGGTWESVNIEVMWSKDTVISTYLLTINGGGTGATGAGSYAKGETVSISAGTNSGYTFANWSSDDGIVFANANSASTSFPMPEKAVTITANWTQGGGSSSNSGSTSSPTPAPSNPSTDAPKTGSAIVTAPVDNKGNANIVVTDKATKDAIKAAKAAAKKENLIGQMISVEIVAKTNGSEKQVVATLPKTVQETLISNKVDTVKITTGSVNMTFDQTAIQAINKKAKADVTITAAKTNTNKLTGEAKTLIGNRPTFDFTATYGSGKRITDFGDNTISISIPYQLEKGEVPGNLYAIYVDSNGKATRIQSSSYDANQQAVIFTTSHFSQYSVGYQESTKFTDIGSHWAKTDIEFATNRGFLSGTSKTTFSPDAGITRAMFVTALGKLAEADVSSYKTGKFSDVKADASYAPYANWAAEKGIVSGTSTTTFSPDKTITRQEMAIFMAKYAKVLGDKLPEVRVLNAFKDNGVISREAAAAVKQLQMAGVLNGKNGNKFDPKGVATRAEVAAMLHRYIALIIDRSTAQGLDSNDSGSTVMYENGKAVKSANRTVNNITYTFNAYGECTRKVQAKKATTI